MKKMIILPSTGVLPKNGGMYGPIETPFMATEYELKMMLFYGAEIFEVIDEDTKVKLTKENYNKDNSGSPSVSPPGHSTGSVSSEDQEVDQEGGHSTGSKVPSEDQKVDQEGDVHGEEVEVLKSANNPKAGKRK